MRDELPAPTLSRNKKVAVEDEFRNFAADRAHRIPHGLIDLLDAWYAELGAPRRVFVCVDVDRANGMVRHFLRELVRCGLPLRVTECGIGPLGADECHIRSHAAPGRDGGHGGRDGCGGVGGGGDAAALERWLPLLVRWCSAAALRDLGRDAETAEDLLTYKTAATRHGEHDP